jgi:hypothetical protein
VLEAVACPGATTCVALGSYEASSSRTRGVIDTYTGSAWQAATMPEPPGANAHDPSPAVLAMACKPGIYCFGVGTYVDAKDDTQGLAIRAASGTWTASMLPGTANRNVVMHAVSCAARAACAAVGSYHTAAGATGYIATLSDGVLTGASTPLPPNADTVSADGLGFVSCRVAGSCVATGTYLESGSAATWVPFVANQ